jgi:tRNA threonylcarbamoyladenosine biosynthesis protein TsaB
VKILALETATDVCSVALSVEGVCYERNLPDRRHAERVIELVDALLLEAGVALRELDVIAFGRGPGMFTGLRIGAGVAQGLAFAADLPVVPVSTLEILAHGSEGDRILAALDARMGQIYWGLFERDPSQQLVAASAERVDAPEGIHVSGTGWIGAGSGWDRYGDTMAAALGAALAHIERGRHPRARDLVTLARNRVRAGGALAPELALPVYVRDDVARKSDER